MKIYKYNIGWLCILLAFVVLTRAIPAAAVTMAEEEKLSKEFMREVTQKLTLIEDPALLNYLSSMGKQITQVLPPNPYQFRFYLVKDSVYNAFAGPGGVIFINSGLWAAMDNPNELAGILAHEITHVISRHISDRIDRSKQIGLTTLAGLLAAVAVGAAGEGEAASAMIVGSMAAGQSMALAYSREDEMQADQLGLKILTKAGFHPSGLVSVMKKIRQQQWVDTDQVPTYLRTHPASEERIVYISAWLERQADLPTPLSPEALTDFNWMHVRLQALYGDKSRMRTFFADAVRKRPADPLAHYGYGLVLTRFDQFEEAAASLKKALARRVFDPQLRIDLGKVYFLGGLFSKALNILTEATTTDPANPEGLYYLGRTYLSLDKPAEAIVPFEDLLKSNPHYRDSMYFAGQAYGQQGHMEEAYYYLGRYNYDLGKTSSALVQLKKALSLTKKSERRSEIEALLKELRAKQKAERSATHP